MFLCSHTFVDDFSPIEPINNVALRQLTGGNNLSAARKHAAEHVFKFRGQLILQAHGVWRPMGPFIGSDRRRHAGLTFDVKFADHPSGKNEMQKDSNIKLKIKTFFAEFWFLARVFWLVPRPRPGSDRARPLCPNSAALVAALMRENDSQAVEIEASAVEAFVIERIMVYKLGGGETEYPDRNRGSVRGVPEQVASANEGILRGRGHRASD